MFRGHIRYHLPVVDFDVGKMVPIANHLRLQPLRAIPEEKECQLQEILQ